LVLCSQEPGERTSELHEALKGQDFSPAEDAAEGMPVTQTNPPSNQKQTTKN
jgi:hypothetical protein